MSRFASVLLLAICLSGCGLFGSDDGPPSLDGEWKMETQQSGTVATFQIDLSEDGQDLTGSGTLTLEDADGPDAATFDLSVGGEHDHPSLFLEMTTESNGDRTTFDGTVESKDRATGTLTFPNGVQQETTLRRR